MAAEGFSSVSIKHEQQPYATVGASSSPHQCQAPRQNCTQPCAQKFDGSLHGGGTLQRRHAKRSDLQRRHLIRLLVDTLKAENDDPTADATGQPRRRPRLVLLGNQKSLILGVVLSEHGDVGGHTRPKF